MSRPGDVEAAAISYLADQGITAGTRRPASTDWQTSHDPVVRVALADRPGVRQLVLDDFTLTVEVWDPDSVAAADLASNVVGTLDRWAGRWAGVHIYQCECRGPRSLDDPDTGTPRYLITASGTARRLDT